MGGIREEFIFPDVEREKFHVEQKRLREQVAVAMSEVQADPRWKLYADHIEAKRQSAQLSFDAAKERLSKGLFLDQRLYLDLCGKIAEARGYVAGLNFCMQIIVDLIERGKPPQEEP